ncbi:hypothetical protein [Lactococcus fujiensis]|nr:hypothetical protein [Lactococcus fujiensis]
MTGLHNQGFVNGLKVALDLFETTDKLELEKVKKERDSLKEAIEHAIATMAHDGRHDNIPISWILPKLITSLATVRKIEGSGDE